MLRNRSKSPGVRGAMNAPSRTCLPDRTAAGVPTDEFLLQVVNSVQSPVFVKDEQLRFALSQRGVLQACSGAAATNSLIGLTDYDVVPPRAGGLLPGDRPQGSRQRRAARERGDADQRRWRGTLAVHAQVDGQGGRAASATWSASSPTSPSASAWRRIWSPPRLQAEDASRAKSAFPRQYEPRAAHAAQRRHRVLGADQAANIRPARPAARGDYVRDVLCRGGTCSADQRHPRHLEGRGRHLSSCARTCATSPRSSGDAIAAGAANHGDSERARRSAWTCRRSMPVPVRRRALRHARSLVNFLSNAIKFTPKGGDVAVVSAAGAGWRDRASPSPIPASAWRRTTSRRRSARSGSWRARMAGSTRAPGSACR